MSTCTVTSDITVRLMTGGPEVELAATFAYFASDPYAVRLSFHVGEPEPVEWTFSRALLRTGLEHAFGPGDVRIWPACDGLLNIELSSPFGQARFELLAEAAAAFLNRTYQAVPDGAEPEHRDDDVDTELADLLRQEGGAR
ncbi:MAG: SsgA family sporulation/cell division regulator [Streptosporangiales bacterium]|nr:SsgA family sporulation/cell division regulator [Streptosporangiales bacterium]